MSDFPFQDWLEKTVNYSGIFACGVRLSNKSSSVRSYHDSYPEARIGDLLQSITEVAFTLRNSQLGNSRLKWVFENGQIHSARRPDGAIAVLATSKDPEAGPSVEELFTDFLSAASAAA